MKEGETGTLWNSHLKNFSGIFYSIWSRVNLLYSRWAEQIGVSYGVLVSALRAGRARKHDPEKISVIFYGLPKQTVERRGPRPGRGRVCGAGKKAGRTDGKKLVVLTDKGRAYAREKLKPIYEGERYAYSLIGGGKVFQMLDVMDAFHTLMKKRMEEES